MRHHAYRDVPSPGPHGSHRVTPAPHTPPRPCVRQCTTRGKHTPSCGAGDCDCVCHRNPAYPPPCDTPGGCHHTTNPDCTGCAPRPALPGGMVCMTCWERTTTALDTLIEIYEDLLTPTRVAYSGRVTGTAESRLVLADGPRWSREWIRVMLLHWRGILARPVEPSKAQRDADTHARKERTRILMAGGTPGPLPDPLPAGPYGRGLSRPTSSDPHDTIRAVHRHAEWLLASEHADQFVYDVLACHADATRTAYPAPPAGVLLGPCPLPTDDDGTPCGGPVRAKVGTLVITCPTCGHTGQPHEWRRIMLARPSQPGHDDPTPGRDTAATGRAIAAWLSAEHGREIRPSLIWQWSCRGTKHGRLPRVGSDPQGRTLYDLATAERIAAAQYAEGTP